MERIEYTRTKASSPQTNGICETIPSDHSKQLYASAFRRTLYQSLEEPHADVDVWVEAYNAERTHTGKYCAGKTPLQPFIESATLAYDKQLSDQADIRTSKRSGVVGVSVRSSLG